MTILQCKNPVSRGLSRQCSFFQWEIGCALNAGAISSQVTLTVIVKKALLIWGVVGMARMFLTTEILKDFWTFPAKREEQ
jgi:hypothetical protein